MRKHFLSYAYRGKSWHEFRSLRGLEPGDSAVGLMVSPATPTAPQLVLWTASALARNASSTQPSTPPLARVAASSSRSRQTAQLDADIWDAEANPVRVQMQYRRKAWDAWSMATLTSVGGLPGGDSEVPANPNGVRHRLVWNAGQDLGASFVGDVLLRIRAADAAEVGAWSEQTYFRIEAAPEITVTDLTANSPVSDGGPAISLGSKALGGSFTRTFRVGNEGSGALNNIILSGTATSGAGMLLPGLTSSVAVGGQQEFTVDFTPTSSGLHTANLEIASTDEDESPYNITLNFTALEQVVTLAASPTSVTEDGGSPIVVTFTRTEPSAAQSVAYTLSGTALPTADYTVSPENTVSFAAGSSTAQLTISPRADGDAEPDETVIVTLAPSQPGLTYGNPTQVTAQILADELPTVVTTAPSGISASGATLGGQVTISGTPVTERGVLHTTNPTVNLATGTKVTLGQGTGSYSASLTNLSPGTTYYARAYAMNSAGAGYGQTVSFTTNIIPTGPGWSRPSGLEHSMTVYAQVDRAGTRVESTGSRLAAFQNNGVAGVAAPIIGPGGIRLYQLTVWSNQPTVAGLPLKVYDASTDEILEILETLSFSSNSFVGNIAAPVLYHVRPAQVDQVIPLTQGWNWISFNTLPTSHTTEAVLAQHTAQDNDVIKGSLGTSTYSGGAWYTSPGFTLDSGRLYLLRRQAAGTANLTVTGRPVDTRQSIALVNGWNWLGYNPQSPRPLNTALSSLTLANNDVVKGQIDDTATYSGDQWFPNLNLTPGRGYLLKVATAQAFSYDPATAGLVRQSSLGAAPAPRPNWTTPVGKEFNMTLYAAVEIGGQRVESGDARLAVMENTTVAGVGTLMQGPIGKLFQIGVWSNSQTAPSLSVKLYDPAQDIVRDLSPATSFEANALRGSISTPMLFTAPALTALELWRHQNFGQTANTGAAQDTADPDKDGLSNLIEFAFNQDPNSGTHQPTSGMPIASMEGTGSSRVLKVEFLRRRNSGLTYQVETNTSLTSPSWQATSGQATVSVESADWERVTVTLPRGQAETRRFARIRVTSP